MSGVRYVPIPSNAYIYIPNSIRLVELINNITIIFSRDNYCASHETSKF